MTLWECCEARCKTKALMRQLDRYRYVLACRKSYPLQVGGSVVALGARWLAYPGVEIIQNAQEEGAVSGAIDNLVEVAKYLGDMSIKTVSSYMYPETQSLPSATEKESGAAGTVIPFQLVCYFF